MQKPYKLYAVFKTSYLIFFYAIFSALSFLCINAALTSHIR